MAINENSNDLELQDINGDVIAKWDETAGQWDLNNNSLTGINAINAETATVERTDSDEYSFGDISQDPQNADTIAWDDQDNTSRPNAWISANAVMDIPADNSNHLLQGRGENDHAAILNGQTIVSIRQQGETDSRTDILSFSFFSTVDLIKSTTRSSPGPTSYNIDSGEGLEIAIDDSGETYDAVVISIGGVPA